MMTANGNRSDSVRKLYEEYPYPSPRSSAQPIFDTAMALDFAVTSLDGRSVLDAGCGTGHRLVGMALQYPQASFVGLDFSTRSLAVASELARAHRCSNIKLVRGEIGVDSLPIKFDVITCTGVIHHLEDPAGGVRWLSSHLTGDGLLYTWHYHSYGEYYRLLDRKLVRLITGNPVDPATASIVSDLHLTMPHDRYGTATSNSWMPAAEDILVAEADAYCHPIVNAYRFQDAAALFGQETEWLTVSGINWQNGSRLIDVTDWASGNRAVLRVDDIFDNARLQGLFIQLDVQGKLQCVELRMRPTGFSMIGGKKSALGWCTPRIRDNVRVANLRDMRMEAWSR